MTRYEGDDKFFSPTPSKHKSINLKSLFREEEPISDTPAIEMVVEIDPNSVISPSPELNNEILLEELQDEFENTIQEDNSQSLTFKIHPPEDNSSDSESLYSGTDCEAELTVIPSSFVRKTPEKSRNKSLESPATPNFSSLPYISQSTPIMPSISDSTRKDSPDLWPNHPQPPRASLGKGACKARIVRNNSTRNTVTASTKKIFSESISNRDPIIIITPDSVMMAQDNYVHIISSDCNLVTPIGYLLTDLGFIHEITLKEQHARRGSVIVSQFGETRIFSLVCRNQYQIRPNF